VRETAKRPVLAKSPICNAPVLLHCFARLRDKHETSTCHHHLRRCPRLFCGDATTLVSHEGQSDWKTNRFAETWRVLVASRDLTARPAHGPYQCSGTRDARLSQRDHDWPVDREHRVERPRHSWRSVQHFGKEVDPSLEEVRQRADAVYATTHLERYRNAFGYASRLRRQPRMRSASV